MQETNDQFKYYQFKYNISFVIWLIII